MRNKKSSKRRSVRLKDFDYSSPNDYYITICSYNRECVFGNIIDGEMILNDLGRIVEREILNTQKIRKNVFIEIFQTMPNRVHLIITILGNNDVDRRGTLQRAPTKERFGKPTSNSIPTIVRLIKSTTTKQINVLRNTPEKHVWQRGYYEHIIRNEKSYDEIYFYILSNPAVWNEDRNNPKNA